MALRANRYFKDYDVETTLQGGKARRVYVYKGDMYAREVSPQARARERIVYLLLAFPAGGLLVAAMLQPTPANLAGVVAAVSILALIPAFCTAEGAVEAFFRKGDLKKGNYQERLLMLRVMPAAGAVLELVMAAGVLVWRGMPSGNAGQPGGAGLCIGGGRLPRGDRCAGILREVPRDQRPPQHRRGRSGKSRRG